jgi:hypothetical protein
MVWGFIRLTIFATAFLLGLAMTNVVGTSPNVASNPSPVPVPNASSGAALVVACDYGKVIVTPLKSADWAVQLNCKLGKMVVVREYKARSGNISDFHPIRTDF